MRSTARDLLEDVEKSSEPVQGIRRGHVAAVAEHVSHGLLGECELSRIVDGDRIAVPELGRGGQPVRAGDVARASRGLPSLYGNCARPPARTTGSS